MVDVIFSVLCEKARIADFRLGCCRGVCCLEKDGGDGLAGWMEGR